MKLQFLFDTEAEAKAFLQGIEYVNDEACQPLDVVPQNGVFAATIDDEDVDEELADA